MTKYQRSIANKIDALSADLASDWEARACGFPIMTRKERAAKTNELSRLRLCLAAAYRGKGE